MDLIVDLGNTKVKFALFQRDVIVKSWREEKETSLEIFQQITQKYQIEKAILSHTSEPDPILIRELNKFNPFITLDGYTAIPIVNLYVNPASLGKDRLAGAVACFKKYPKQASLFIDMGTCITFNFINSEGEFLGGNISPGISMRLKAMHQFTDKLPMAEIQVNDTFFARDTRTALQNGAVKGAFYEIETFIHETRKDYGPFNVILTGGDAHLFENYTKNEIFVAPFLVLEGLNEILKYNAK